jgi:peroxiredoxin family protein
MPAQGRLTIVIHGGDLDRLLAAMTMATGAASTGIEVSLFFAFWATAALRGKPIARKRSFMERALGWMLPSGYRQTKLSRLHMGGVGTALVKRRMRAKRFAGLDELFDMAADLGVSIYVCDMSMDLLGMQMDDLIDYPNIQQCGVPTFMSRAMESNVTLFV